MIRRRDALALGVLVALIGIAAGWGAWLQHRGAPILLSGAEPLMGPLRVRVTPGTAACVAVGAVAVLWLPWLLALLSWRWLLVVSAAATAVWSVLLALVDGLDGGFTTRIARSDSYLAEVHGFTGGVGGLLHQFIRRIPGGPDQWATHVAGHPPGALLSFWWLDRVGLGGAGWAAALCIVGGAVAVPAVLVTASVLAGERAARGAAPYLALLPAAVWIAVSPDAYFAGVSAWGIALLALAGARRGWRADVLALAGGLVLGWSLFLSYGLVLVAPLAVVVVITQRRVRPLVVAAVGVAAVAAAFALGGFWWTDGLHATSLRVRAGRGGHRPYGYFVLADFAAAGIAVGPAIATALARVRRPVALLVAAAGVGIALAALSGLARGEVERIWLPFYPWLALASVALPVANRRHWLAAQVALAIVVQTVVLGRW